MSGGGQEVARPRAQARGRRQQHQKPSLPFDVMVEIAACSDPATLVRFAATCQEARHRVADGDDAFRGRLRLRHTDRFVLPLLRGHLTGDPIYMYVPTSKQDLWLVDTTAADATSLVKVRRGFASSSFGENLTGLQPVSSREGLLLIRATNKQSHREQLLVCEPATRRSQTLPDPQPDTFPRCSSTHHVLLVDNGETGGASEVGRPFQVLKARIVTSGCRAERCLQIQTFSSEQGIWGPFNEIPTPNLHGNASYMSSSPLVVDGVLHWLCLTNSGSYVLMLHVKAERVTITTLPTRLPRAKQGQHDVSYLLATNSMGGSPIVLVAHEEKISMWVQCKHTKRWKEQPQVVIRNEEILEFVGNSLRGRPKTVHIKLLWFSERSGAALISIPYWCFFWLDLQSKKIVRWFYDRRLHYASVYCPYEIDLSSWVPTFSSGLC